MITMGNTVKSSVKKIPDNPSTTKKKKSQNSLNNLTSTKKSNSMNSVTLSRKSEELVKAANLISETLRSMESGIAVMEGRKAGGDHGRKGNSKVDNTDSNLDLGKEIDIDNGNSNTAVNMTFTTTQPSTTIPQSHQTPQHSVHQHPSSIFDSGEDNFPPFGNNHPTFHTDFGTVTKHSEFPQPLAMQKEPLQGRSGDSMGMKESTSGEFLDDRLFHSQPNPRPIQATNLQTLNPHTSQQTYRQHLPQPTTQTHTHQQIQPHPTQPNTHHHQPIPNPEPSSLITEIQYLQKQLDESTQHQKTLTKSIHTLQFKVSSLESENNMLAESNRGLNATVQELQQHELSSRENLQQNEQISRQASKSSLIDIPNPANTTTITDQISQSTQSKSIPQSVQTLIKHLQSHTTKQHLEINSLLDQNSILRSENRRILSDDKVLRDRVSELIEENKSLNEKLTEIQKQRVSESTGGEDKIKTVGRRDKDTSCEKCDVKKAGNPKFEGVYLDSTKFEKFFRELDFRFEEFIGLKDLFQSNFPNSSESNMTEEANPDGIKVFETFRKLFHSFRGLSKLSFPSTITTPNRQSSDSDSSSTYQKIQKKTLIRPKHLEKLVTTLFSTSLSLISTSTSTISTLLHDISTLDEKIYRVYTESTTIKHETESVIANLRIEYAKELEKFQCENEELGNRLGMVLNELKRVRCDTAGLHDDSSDATTTTTTTARDGGILNTVKPEPNKLTQEMKQILGLPTQDPTHTITELQSQINDLKTTNGSLVSKINILESELKDATKKFQTLQEKLGVAEQRLLSHHTNPDLNANVHRSDSGFGQNQNGQLSRVRELESIIEDEKLENLKFREKIKFLEIDIENLNAEVEKYKNLLESYKNGSGGSGGDGGESGRLVRELEEALQKKLEKISEFKVAAMVVEPKVASDGRSRLVPEPDNLVQLRALVEENSKKIQSLTTENKSLQSTLQQLHKTYKSRELSYLSKLKSLKSASCIIESEYSLVKNYLSDYESQFSSICVLIHQQKTFTGGYESLNKVLKVEEDEKVGNDHPFPFFKVVSGVDAVVRESTLKINSMQQSLVDFETKLSNQSQRLETLSEQYAETCARLQESEKGRELVCRKVEETEKCLKDAENARTIAETKLVKVLTGCKAFIAPAI